MMADALHKERSDVLNYAALVNSKVIIPSASSNYLAVDRHFLINVMQGFVQQIFVDEPWYLDNYPDVRSAIKGGIFSSALDHYARFGFFENRMPYAIKIDETWYLKSYPDIKAAIDDKQYTSGQSHFDEVGYLEGRLPYPEFCLKLMSRSRVLAQPAARVA